MILIPRTPGSGPGVFFVRAAARRKDINMPSPDEALVMDAVKIDRTLTRMAHEIVEKNREMEDLVLVGIRTRGVPLAERLARKIHEIEEVEVPVGLLDITLYRDDATTIGPHALLKATLIHFPIDGKKVILVDDVLFTGRTIRAALDGSWTSAAPAASSWRSWWTGDTGNFPSGPTTSGKTSPRRGRSGWT